jgi:hypothetical protein
MTPKERAELLASDLEELSSRLDEGESIDGWDLLKQIESLSRSARRLVEDIG